MGCNWRKAAQWRCTWRMKLNINSGVGLLLLILRFAGVSQNSSTILSIYIVVRTTQWCEQDKISRPGPVQGPRCFRSRTTPTILTANSKVIRIINNALHFLNMKRVGLKRCSHCARHRTTSDDVVRCRPMSSDVAVIEHIDLTAMFTYRTMSYVIATTLPQKLNLHLFFIDMTTYSPKIAEKTTPPSFGTFFWDYSLRIFRRLIYCQKLESRGYQMVYISRSCFRLIGTILACDGRTDVRTDRHVAVAKTALA